MPSWLINLMKLGWPGIRHQDEHIQWKTRSAQVWSSRPDRRTNHMRTSGEWRRHQTESHRPEEGYIGISSSDFLVMTVHINQLNPTCTMSISRISAETYAFDLGIIWGLYIYISLSLSTSFISRSRGYIHQPSKTFPPSRTQSCNLHFLDSRDRLVIIRRQNLLQTMFDKFPSRQNMMIY